MKIVVSYIFFLIAVQNLPCILGC